MLDSEDFHRAVFEQCHLTPDRPIVAGVSGGPDSLCLLDLLVRAGLRVVVAHYNHSLRPESDADAAAVEGLASRLELTAVIERGDVRAFADQESLSIEEAARILRYRFLFSVARKHKAQAVAVGHTADDQVETVLMHFLRGAGLSGLKGMSVRTYLPTFDADLPLVRPLLGIWREQTVAYCADHNLPVRDDPSNASLQFFRNRLRHVLIPDLEKYNPRIREGILRMAETLSGDYALLNEVLGSAWEACLAQEGSGYVTFDAQSFEARSLGLQRNLIRRALERVRPELRDLDFAALERATDMIQGRSPGPVDLSGGVRLFREGGRLFVAAWEADLPKYGWLQIPQGELAIPVPGDIPLGGGWRLTGACLEMSAATLDQARQNANPFQAWLDADQLVKPLQMRLPQPGDRFEPLGMHGSSLKLSDFFINLKLPRRARAHWPLLMDQEKIVWVPGCRLAHSVRLTDSTRQVVYLSVTRMESEMLT
jgi:tRNA(Ile)-lysidine synthase